MTDVNAGIARRPSRLIGILKSIALLRESVVGMIGAFLVLFWVAMAIFANVIAPFEPNANLLPFAAPGSELILSADQEFEKQPVSEVCDQIFEDGAATGNYDCGTFWLGADDLGRDILSRIIFGSRTVLFYAPLATFFAYLVGVPMGLAAGYCRGMVDGVLSFIGNVILSFPVLVLYIIIISTFESLKKPPVSNAPVSNAAVSDAAVSSTTVSDESVSDESVFSDFFSFDFIPDDFFSFDFNILDFFTKDYLIVLAVVFASAPGIMRIVRGLALDLRNREYVFAAETRGESTLRIMLVEILPNARGPLIVDSCVRIGYVIITIGVLGFLGLGLPPPDPDWGGMINSTRQMAMAFPHMTVFPCLAISSLVLGFNLLADGMREVSLRD